MCYFLTVAVPERSRELIAGLKVFGLSVWENTNPSVRAVLPPGTVPFWVTDGHCSCKFESRQWKPFDEEGERARYQKRGWSHAKIDRAVAAKRPMGPPEPIRQLHDGLRELVERAGVVYLFGRTYSGNQTVQPVTARGREDSTFSEFLASRGRCPDDVVVTLRSG